MNRAGQDDEVKRGATKRLGKVRRQRVAQQRAAGQHEGKEVNDGCMQERLDVVVIKLRPSLLHFFGKLGLEPLAEAGDRLVELGRFILRIGCGHPRERPHGRMDFPGPGGIQKARAGGDPMIARRLRVERRHIEDEPGLRHHPDAMKRLFHPLKRLLVEILFRFPGARLGADRGEPFFESQQFLLEIDSVFRLQAVFEAVKEHHRIGQLEELLLVGGSQFRLHFAGFLALVHDLLRHRADFLERIVTQRRLLDALVLQFQLADEIRMMDQEDRAAIRLRRPGHHFEQPFGRFQLFRVMPKLPGGHLLERDVARAADLQEGIAGDGVKRLNATVEQGGQPPELAEMKLAVFLRQHHHRHFRGEQRHQQPGQSFPEPFHAILHFVAKPIKWVRNWTTNPSATNPQAK